GKFIAYASQARPGFESDRWRMMLYDRATKTAHELFPSWDRNADSYFFSPDNVLCIQTTDAGREKLFCTPPVSMPRSGQPKIEAMVTQHNNASFALSRDGKTMVWLRDAT